MTPEQMREAADYLEMLAKHTWAARVRALARLLREQADAIDTDLLAERTRLLHAAEERIAELETFVRRVATYPRMRSQEITVEIMRDAARALLPPPPEEGK